MTVCRLPLLEPLPDGRRRHEPAARQRRPRASASSAGRPRRARSAPRCSKSKNSPAAGASALNSWLPPARANTLYGGGGGTSYQYPSPPTRWASYPPPWPNATPRSLTSQPRRARHLDGRRPDHRDARRRDPGLPRRHLLRRVPDRRHEPLLAALRRRDGARRPGRRRVARLRQPAALQARRLTRHGPQTASTTSCLPASRRSPASTTSTASTQKEGTLTFGAHARLRGTRGLPAAGPATAPTRRLRSTPRAALTR